MKLAMIGATLLTLATMLAGCSSQDSVKPTATGTVGDINLELKVGDVVLNSLHYVLSDSVHVYTGDLNVSGSDSLFAMIGGVEKTAMTNAPYTLQLSALTSVGDCSGRASNIYMLAGTVTTVAVNLHCSKTATTGTLRIGGTLNQCPTITSVTVDPFQGTSLPLHVTATDDGVPSALTYTWTGATGLLGRDPVLACQNTGPTTLSVSVSDGDPDASCAAKFTFTVPCPPPSPAPCSDVVLPGTSPDAGACPPSTAQMLELLNPKHSSSCLTCAQTMTVGSGCSLGEVNCEMYSVAERSHCVAALQCVLPSSCVHEEYSDLSPCYCGNAMGSACLNPGATDGVCKTALEQGFPSTDPVFIAGHLDDTYFGTGAAMRLMSCLADYGCFDCF